MTVSPSSLNLCPGDAGGSQVYLQSVGGFSGSVGLSATLPSGFAWTSFFVNPLSVQSGGSASTLFQIATGGAPLGTYTSVVTARSGSLAHVASVQVTVTLNACGCNPCGGGGSVAAGTLITMADNTDVPVQLVRVGSLVRTYNVFAHIEGTAIVTDVRIVTVGNRLTIFTAFGLSFRTDSNPQFRLHVMQAGQVVLLPVTEIVPGDLLFNYDYMTWVPVTRVQVDFGGKHTVYDLTISPIGDFIANGYADCVKACRL